MIQATDDTYLSPFKLTMAGVGQALPGPNGWVSYCAPSLEEKGMKGREEDARNLLIVNKHMANNVLCSDKLILRKIIKIVAIRCHIYRPRI